MKPSEFEPQIAYMYGASHTIIIQQEYMKAVRKMHEAIGTATLDCLKEKMIPHFKKCYESIQRQIELRFSINEAANNEFDLFMAHKNNADFDEVIIVQNKLYASVIGGKPDDYTEASHARVKLFKLFRAIEASQQDMLTESQIKEMLALHQTSIKILNNKIDSARTLCC